MDITREDRAAHEPRSRIRTCPRTYKTVHAARPARPNPPAESPLATFATLRYCPSSAVLSSLAGEVPRPTCYPPFEKATKRHADIAPIAPIIQP